MNAMELDPNSAIETKGKRLVPRWLAISAVVISTLSLLICALALLWIADSEEKEIEKLEELVCVEGFGVQIDMNIALAGNTGNTPILDIFCD